MQRLGFGWLDLRAGDLGPGAGGIGRIRGRSICRCIWGARLGRAVGVGCQPGALRFRGAIRFDRIVVARREGPVFDHIRVRDPGGAKGSFRGRWRPDMEHHVRHPPGDEGEEGDLRRDHRRPRLRRHPGFGQLPRLLRDVDQRVLRHRLHGSAGIGRSGPIQCTKAAAVYYVSAARPQIPAERADAAAAAETFAKDCIAEAGVAESDLPFYATTQAVEDLEAVRDYLDVDKMDLYGLSYGTQFVQTYAAAHPDHIATLYVDGPVDLTVDGPTYYVEAARSAEDTLIATMAACAASETCTADVAGGDALAAYDALAAKLDSRPITFDFPISDGTTVSRALTNADLENAAFNALYYSYDRLLLQRAIAAASHADYVPLAKLAYSAVGLNQDTLVAEVDPGYSDAMYYAVECQDYAFYPDAGDPEARLTAWIDGAVAAGINDTRLETSYYGDLPCLYWPTARATNERPAPIVDPPYPVFVLTSTTDPATPIANGMRIYSRLQDAYFFQAVGGPHVIYAWGQSCPDDLMTAWLVDRTPPPTRITTCIWDLADPYAAIAASAASGYKNALALAKSTDAQIFNSYDFIYFDGDQVTAGCDYGGSITYASSDTGTEVRLHACEFTADLPLTGKGETDDDAGTFVLDVTSGADKLHYERDGEGATAVQGIFHGKKVDQKGAA